MWRSEEQSQEADDVYDRLFAGMDYEADGVEADKVYELVDKNTAARQRTRRCANTPDAVCVIDVPALFTTNSGKKRSDRSFSNSLLVSNEASLQ